MSNTTQISGTVNWIERQRKEAEEKIKKIQVATANKFFIEYVEPTLQNIYADVVDDFYGGYSPEYYERQGDLYKLLDVSTEIGSDGIASLTYGFKPEEMTPFRGGYTGEDGLYDQVFRRGWHGGAIGRGDNKRGDSYTPNVPSYRWPYELYTWWGRPAVIAPISPLEDFNKRVEEYWGEPATKELSLCWDACINEIL